MLTAKLAAIGGGVLLVVIAIMGIMLHRANAHIDQLTGNLAECNAARADQNAAVQRLHDEGIAQQHSFDEAVQHGQDAIAQAQGRVRVVRETAANGCRTPDVVMGAGL